MFLKSPSALLAALLTLQLFVAEAQVVFSEDFENGMPVSFTLVDGDGRTPAAQTSYVTDAWVVLTDFADTNNSVAVSNSYYEPVGQADDWMITPVIQLDSFCVLQWKAEAVNPTYPDGYEVRISTTGTDTSQFLANPPLFAIGSEEIIRTSRRVELSVLGYASENVHIAFRNNSDDKWTLLVDDIEVINRPLIDAAVLEIGVPASACNLTAAEEVSVEIENFGRTPISNFGVSFVVNDGITSDTITENVPTVILPGDTLSYVFTQGANLSVPGTGYVITAFVTLAGDSNNNNAMNSGMVVHVVPHDADSIYSTGFENVNEVLGWSVEDANGDGFSWGLTGSNPISGDLSFIYLWNNDGATGADDWLYSTCIDLVAGEMYRLVFFYNVGAADTIYAEKLEVKLGTQPDVSSMTTLLENLGEVWEIVPEEHKIIFTAAATGTYHIGFHCYSDPDDYFLKLDDVSFGKLVPPVAGFVTGKNELQVNFLDESTGEVDSLYWDFGDGSNAEGGTSVSHTYAAPGTYYACLTAFNQAGSDIFCDSVTVDTLTATGIHSISGLSIRIYPNPAGGLITVETGRIIPGAVITVTDVAGRELMKSEFGSLKMSFDLGEVAEGFYFVEVNAGGSTIREKVLIAR